MPESPIVRTDTYEHAISALAGKLDFRMEDARHRVSLADEEKPVD